MRYTLSHEGVARRSGRYPWGSGKDPKQRNKDFLGIIDDLKKQGLSEVEIAKGVAMNTKQLRNRKSLIKEENKQFEFLEASKLKEKGYSYVAIGKKMGKPESSIRALLDPESQAKSEVKRSTVNAIKDAVDKKKYIDIGIGTERNIGVARAAFQVAISDLQTQGYFITYVPVPQLGTGKNTNMMVLSKPNNKDTIEIMKLRNTGHKDSEISKITGIKDLEIKTLVKEAYSDVFKNKANVKLITDYSENKGLTFRPFEPIKSVDSKRVQIRYEEDGGRDKDGIIELRRGIDDISLGKSKYAQVRIGVDDTHFMKGMAVYNDDIPKGIDIIYNTNKSSVVPKEKVFKELSNDIENPFGATVRQRHYMDKDGKEKLSSLNIINEEGEWHDKWSKKLSSQMLSKQSDSLAKKQLGLMYSLKKEEFDEINVLNNPSVKKRLLDSFAGDVDSAAVHLKAAAMPRTSWHVLLPLPNIKPTEIYAPNYRDGEKVVLIRYPHGGIFEIPELTVNNKNKDGIKLFGRARDAIGIHPKTAEQLSGADYDGDAALVIPNNNKAIKTAPILKELIGYDPKVKYKPYDGMRTIDGGVWDEKNNKVDYMGKKPTSTKGRQMGVVSNLITDMTIQGANLSEIARAVKHSMTVIDSEKHHLDYKASAIDNRISELHKLYQSGGASTLISRAKSKAIVTARKESIDPLTGRKVYIDTTEPYINKKGILIKPSNPAYINKQGELVKPTIKSTKLAETEDAFTLSSGTTIETVYAAHANRLKSLANEARKEAVNIKYPPYNADNKKVYAKEVASLISKLNIALKNAPFERQAQVIANANKKAKMDADPYMDVSDIKKIEGQELAKARTRIGAKKENVVILDKEWEAIQSGAITKNVLKQILDNTDIDKVKQLATPRTNNTEISPTKIRKAKLMLETGYTQAQVADSIGISTSTLSKLITI